MFRRQQQPFARTSHIGRARTACWVVPKNMFSKLLFSRVQATKYGLLGLAVSGGLYLLLCSRAADS
jgi:hypothetical protein